MIKANLFKTISKLLVLKTTYREIISELWDCGNYESYEGSSIDRLKSKKVI